MNGTFIFFKTRRLCSKSIETEAVFTKIKMNDEWNIHFLKTRVGLKSIKTEAVFTKTEMNND